MIPYEAVIGRAPPILLDYMTGTTSIAAVDDFLSDRSVILRTLKENLQKAQVRMKNQADAKCTDVSFAVGN